MLRDQAMSASGELGAALAAHKPEPQGPDPKFAEHLSAHASPSRERVDRQAFPFQFLQRDNILLFGHPTRAFYSLSAAEQEREAEEAFRSGIGYRQSGALRAEPGSAARSALNWRSASPPSPQYPMDRTEPAQEGTQAESVAKMRRPGGTSP